MHAEEGYVEMYECRIIALVFLIGHGIKARTHVCVEITHFPSRCMIRTWKALGLQPRASQALMMHLDAQCEISAWAWVFAISPL